MTHRAVIPPARTLQVTEEEELEFQKIEAKLGLAEMEKMHQEAILASIQWIDSEDPKTLFTMSLRKIFEVGYIKGLQNAKK